MTQKTDSELVVKVARDEHIAIPSSEQEKRIAIRYLDWDRIKTRLSRVKEPVPRLHLIYSWLFGVSSTSCLTIITLSSTSQNLPVWLIPLYWCVFIFALLCAIVFVYTDKKLSSKKVSDLTEIIDDMNIVEKSFRND